MKMKLETPQEVYEAGAAQKGMHWMVELLVAVLLFAVITVGQTILLLPVQFTLMFNDSDFMAAALAGDVNEVTELSMQLIKTDTMGIAMLFTNIVLTGMVFLFCRLIQKRKLRTLGFVKKNAVREYLIGLCVGFVIFSAAVLICVVTGALKLTGLSEKFSVGVFFLFLLGYLIQGMAEEVYFRGYLMISIGRRYPIWTAVLLSSVFFALLHLFNSGISLFGLVNLTLFGVFGAVYFIKRGNIWGISAVHSIWNFAQGNLYGIRVSGRASDCTVFTSSAVEGRAFINGGAFGLEGGFAITLVLLAGILFLLSRPAKDSFAKEYKTLDNAQDGAL